MAFSRRFSQPGTDRTKGRRGAPRAAGSAAGAGNADSTDSAENLDSAGNADSAASADNTAHAGLSPKMRAIGYLSRREYSRLELSRKLARHVEDAEEIQRLLDVLQKEGWLSDERFAHSLVHRRAARYGAQRVLGELKQHALDDELVRSVSVELRASDSARAKAVWQKKFGTLPTTPAERAKQGRFLAMRGFSRDAISRLLKGDDDWPDEDASI